MTLTRIYFILILHALSHNYLHAMILSEIAPLQVAGVDSKEYIVLFRGNHFGKDTNAEQIAAINYDLHEPVDSRYVSLSRDSYNTSQRRTLARQKLAQMRESGPYRPKASSGESSRLPYPSEYHWVLELYVNKYAEFKKQLLVPTSELSLLLKKYGLSFDDIFFVSTSLNAKTAVKYACGLCSGGYRNWPNWKLEEINKQATVGYLDVFIIPRKDLHELGAFPVVEEFALHTMKLSHHYASSIISSAP